MKTLAVTMFLLAIAVGATGCVPCPETHVTVDQLVAEHNANATRIPKIWSRAKIRLVVKQEGKLPLAWGSTSPLAPPNGLLLLFKRPEPLGPQDFLLLGYETALGAPLFKLASSVDEGVYYLWYSVGDNRGGWVGRHAFAGAPGTRIPIDPTQLVSVLGVLELPGDFTTLPTVTMRMSCDPCAYVVTFLDRQAVTNRIVYTRGVYFNWDDSELRRPFRVELFDSNGDLALVAKLGEYKPVDLGESAQPAAVGDAEPPFMPTDIRISWPGNGSSVHIVLSDMTVDPDRGDVEAVRFRDEGGELPAGLSPSQIIDVDRDLLMGDNRP